MTEKSKMRLIYLISFFIGLLAVIMAVYFQIIDHLNPCPLCIMQRIAYLLIAFISIIAVVHGPVTKRANYIYLVLLIIVSIIGASIAIRQLYIEFYPSTEAHSCGIGIGYLFYNMPFKDFLLMMFNGSADCGIVSWTFLGLSMAFWSMILFLVLMVLYFIISIRHISKLKHNLNQKGP